MYCLPKKGSTISLSNREVDFVKHLTEKRTEQNIKAGNHHSPPGIVHYQNELIGLFGEYSFLKMVGYKNISKYPFVFEQKIFSANKQNICDISIPGLELEVRTTSENRDGRRLGFSKKELDDKVGTIFVLMHFNKKNLTTQYKGHYIIHEKTIKETQLWDPRYYLDSCYLR